MEEKFHSECEKMEQNDLDAYARMIRLCVTDTVCATEPDFDQKSGDENAPSVAARYVSVCV
jgi:hypothetical protein